jgi:hypothetical protein
LLEPSRTRVNGIARIDGAGKHFDPASELHMQGGFDLHGSTASRRRRQMNHQSDTRSFNLAIGALGALLAAACGGGDSGGGASANFSALRTEYTKPTGTLKATDMKAVLKSLTQSQGASQLGPLSEHAPSAGASGLHLEGSSTPMCTQSGSGASCTCTNGGKYEVTEAASSGEQVSGTVHYDHCDFGGQSYDDAGDVASLVMDGNMSFAFYTSPPPAMYIYSGTITETITPPGTTATVQMNYAMIGSSMAYLVDVADGSVVVTETSWSASSNTGTLSILDASTTWTCTLTDGAGSCSSTDGSSLDV